MLVCEQSGVAIGDDGAGVADALAGATGAVAAGGALEISFGVAGAGAPHAAKSRRA